MAMAIRRPGCDTTVPAQRPKQCYCNRGAKRRVVQVLTERRAAVLQLIIDDYVRSAVPVGSENIVKTYGLGLSSATLRNEMARLEEDGYISHPHTSAGRVPSDKGYRYYHGSAMP